MSTLWLKMSFNPASVWHKSSLVHFVAFKTVHRLYVGGPILRSVGEMTLLSWPQTRGFNDVTNPRTWSSGQKYCSRGTVRLAT